MVVHIVGKGNGWQDAPAEGNVWGITQLICRRPVGRVIDMNDYSLWGPLEAEEATKARGIAAERGIEYIDRDNYPLQEIIEQFGIDYFTGTVDYAIALALYEEHDDIHLWGVNVVSDSEYRYQKPGVDFWCGYALGRGARLTVHGDLSAVMQTRDGKLYGYGFPQTMRAFKEQNGGMRCGGVRRIQ